MNRVRRFSYCEGFVDLVSFVFAFCSFQEMCVFDTKRFLSQ